MIGLRYRPGRVGDIEQAIPMLQADGPSLGQRVWSSFPELLRELLVRQTAKAYVIEEDAGGRLRWFGLSAFLNPEVQAMALQQTSKPFREFLFQTALDKGDAFLSQKEIAVANAGRNLMLTVLVCQPDVGDYTREQGGLLFRIAYESFCFAHAGYGLESFWQEVADPNRAEILDGLGLISHRTLKTADGSEHFLLSYSRQRALKNFGQAMSFIFNQPLPRFGFSPSQQLLLESALLDICDREFAVAHRVSDDAVKKRWRSIYDRLAAIEPRLAATELAGTNQRRQLIGYLRRHLEELRPFHRARMVRPIHLEASEGTLCEQLHRPGLVDDESGSVRLR